MGYQFIHVFAKFAGNFGEETDIYDAVGAESNEAHVMPAGKLLTLLRCGIVPASRRARVEENIRISSYALLIVEDSWDAPPATFRPEYNVALQCKSDPALPMREVVVLFRKLREGEESDGRLALFRKSMNPADGLQLDFADAAEFRAHLESLFRRWAAEQ